MAILEVKNLNLGFQCEDTFRQALFEKIEDEFDLAVADEAHREWEEDGKKTYSWDEFKKELDL